MNKIVTILLVTFSLVSCAEEKVKKAQVPIAEAKNTYAIKKVKKANAPLETSEELDIQASTLEYRRKEGLIIFNKNVELQSEGIKLFCDKMTAHVDTNNDMRLAICEGNVIALNKDQKITCGKAVYDIQAERIYFIRNPQVFENGNYTKARRITLIVKKRNDKDELHKIIFDEAEMKFFEQKK